MKKPTKPQELTTTIQIEAWRQRLTSENRNCKNRDKHDLEKLKDVLEEKNTYMHYYKAEETKQKERLDQMTKSNFAYDMAKAEDENNYCKKCKYESKWCKHRKEREVAKQQLGAAITTTQQYGWREPYDDLTFGYNRSGICKRTFFNFGHLS